METQQAERTATAAPPREAESKGALTVQGQREHQMVAPQRRMIPSEEVICGIDRMAELVTQMGEVPRGFVYPGNHPVTDLRGSPNLAKIKIAMLKGWYLDIDPLQSLQIICVINGIPSVYGDGALALVERSGLLEDIAEEEEGEKETFGYVVTVKRVGRPTPIVRRFMWADAVRAGLNQKEGPWQHYPTRMIQMRARAWALRDAFPDILSGLGIAEEIQDATGSYEVHSPETRPQEPSARGPVVATQEETPTFMLHDWQGQETEEVEGAASFLEALSADLGQLAAPQNRIAMLNHNDEAIARAREWLEKHEPGSDLPMVIETLGKRAKDQWEADERDRADRAKEAAETPPKKRGQRTARPPRDVDQEGKDVQLPDAPDEGRGDNAPKPDDAAFRIECVDANWMKWCYDAAETLRKMAGFRAEDFAAFERANADNLQKIPKSQQRAKDAVLDLIRQGKGE
jgi:hypothetical protein